ncbi:hypothetical protein Lal_00018452, partial [Lupinus albus]
VWKEAIEIILGYLDLDLTLHLEKPISTSKNLDEGSISKGQYARKFLEEIEQYFSKNEKAETSSLLAKLISMKYKGKWNIREYIMEMSNLASKLKSLKMKLRVLHVQEDERLQRDKTESVHLVMTPHDKKRKSNKGVAKVPSQLKKLKSNAEFTCNFCKKQGHIKKECPKYATWRVKKGKFLNLVCSEINLAFVPNDTWWVDSGATTHISITMHDCLWSRQPSDDEKFIFVGDGKRVAIEAIGTFRLHLRSGFHLDLFETFVVQSFRRNLISVFNLDKFGFSCSFGSNKVSLYQNSNVVGYGSLIDNLYIFYFFSSNSEVLQTNSRGTKRKLNENSVILWHKRLSHISKQRIQRLVSDEILDPLDLSNFEVCVECIKGKQRNKKNS